MEDGFETIRGRVEMYELLSKQPDEESLYLLKEAVKCEERESVRAYIIILCAEMMKALGYNEQAALGLIDELQNIEEIKQAKYCLGSCYLARYMFGDTTVKNQVEEMLGERDAYEEGLRELLDDMKVTM